MALSVDHMHTSDALHLRHTLDISQRGEPSRNFGVVLNKYWRLEIVA